VVHTLGIRSGVLAMVVVSGVSGLGLAAAGCKKKAEKKLVPFEGALTGARIMASKDLVKPFDKWERGLAKLEAQLGKPTRIKDGGHAWAVVEGESCTYVEVSMEDGAKYNKKGPMVGAVQEPMQVTKKDGPVMNWRDCLAITGVTAGPPEDPSAPAPPSDGSVVDLATLKDVAIRGRSKWKGARVKVTGQLGGVSTSTSGSQTFTTVSLRVSEADQDTVSCSLVEGAAAPTLTQGAQLVVEGTVTIDEWLSMGGDATLKVGLDKCQVVGAPDAVPAPTPVPPLGDVGKLRDRPVG